MDFEGVIAIIAVLIGLPWLILHYVTKWRGTPKITEEDERMLDEMYNLARRLEDRLNTVERIVAADNPNWRPGLNPPSETSRPLSQPHQPQYQLDRRN